jgi:hypothetical protein
MTKVRQPSELDKAIQILDSLIDEFDPDDREEMQTRADMLTDALLESGLVARSPDDYLLSLDDVVKSLRMKSSKMAGDVVSFYRALSSYEEDYDAMESAHESLQKFGPVLLEDLKQAKAKWSNQQRLPHV